MGQLKPTISNESSPTKDEFRKIYMVCNYLIGVVFSEFKKMIVLQLKTRKICKSNLDMKYAKNMEMTILGISVNHQTPKCESHKLK